MIDYLENAGGEVDRGGAYPNISARSRERVGLPSSDVPGILVAGDDKELHEADAPEPQDFDGWLQPRQR